jgi:3-mercaptopyruvate sulfurtransferase SseA
MVIFVAVIVVGLLSLKTPRLTYVLTPEQTLALVTGGEGCVHPYQLVPVLNGTVDTVILIDIRNKFEFGKGHIKGAENISAYDLTNEENIARLKEFKKNGMAVVLYGNTQLEANGPWMVFRQLGFDNVMLLLGGYRYYALHKHNLAATKGDKSYLPGIADFNYAEVAK